MEKSNWSSCLGCKDGFYTKSSLGKGFTEDNRSKRSNFAGVIFRDSICIIFTYAALNDLNVLAADIKICIFRIHPLRNTTLFVERNLENTKVNMC